MMTDLNAIKLPPASGPHREIRRPLSEEKKRLYAQGKLGQYDTDTIFYDVFLQADGRTLLAIGPPLLNLERILLPATLKIGGFSLPFKTHTRFKKLQILKVDLPPAVAGQHALSGVTIAFANGLEQSITLAAPHLLQGKSLVTVQKNNKLRWIKEWMAYYRGEYGIDHIYIYDNGSDDQAALTEQLQGKAKIIPWNFPYGINDGSSNKFCQVGALNHFKQRYAGDSLILNFDIDELLVCRNERAKRTVLSGALMRFSGYYMHYHQTKFADYGFSDFMAREATPQEAAYKYVTPGKLAGILNVHYFRRDCLLQSVTPKSVLSGPVMPVEDAYFLHYIGISNNWKRNRTSRFVGEDKLKTAVEELSIVDAFARLRI